MYHSDNISLTKPLMTSRFLIGLCLGLLVMMAIGAVIHQAEAAESQSRTESNCTIGMAKGEKIAECHVPILNGCTVAQFPGYNEPWAEASKGGATSCQFDTEKTDWKTAIVGTCQACKTEHCTGRFTVMFNCAENVPSASPAFPQPK
jgi:hypothetical protein